MTVSHAQPKNRSMFTRFTMDELLSIRKHCKKQKIEYSQLIRGLLKDNGIIN